MLHFCIVKKCGMLCKCKSMKVVKYTYLKTVILDAEVSAEGTGFIVTKNCQFLPYGQDDSPVKKI